MISILTQDKEFFPSALADKLAFVKAMGFDGFEVDGKILLEQFDELQSAINQTGFPVVTACGGYGGWIGDFDEEKRQKGLSDIITILKRLETIGAKGIVLPAAWGMFSLRLPPLVPPRSPAEDKRILLDSLSRLNEVATKHNVTVFLEPLNRYEDHMINTLEQARYYIDEGSFSQVALIADFYHMNIEEANMEESIMAQKNFIRHIHLADSHRYQPGSGHTDFETGFSALKEIGYTGAMAFECRVMGDNAAEAYQSSLQFIRNLISKIWSAE